jgi:hypothetical protein
MRTLVILVFSLLLACNNHDKQDNTKQTAQNETTLLSKDTVPVKHFIAPVTFTDFMVDTFKGKKAAIDYGSSPTATRFRTVITETYNRNNIMFGGHFIFVRWGCGSACKSGALVDVRNGTIYDLPTATLDYSFQKDSRLLIVNPPNATGHYEDCGYCKPELWIWNDNQKKFEQFNIKK